MMPVEEAQQAVVDTLKAIDTDSDGAITDKEIFKWLRRSYGCALRSTSRYTKLNKKILYCAAASNQHNDTFQYTNIRTFTTESKIIHINT